ncbi:MAG: ribbon-helix-helix protein, CopG family [Myxococcota bacterium]|jgi:predicted transcriptional regulator|nr:ribbon-helix-helix protein, CopG family [Myxococcota bacterium]
MASTTIGVKVDQALRERLKALAEARSRSPHWIVKEAIAEYLTREEAVERERVEDEARWERFALTGEAVPHERVRSWLEALAAGEDDECPR